MSFNYKSTILSHLLFILLLPFTVDAKLISGANGADAEVTPNIVVVAWRNEPKGTSLLRQTGDAELDALFVRYKVTHIEKLIKNENQTTLLKRKPQTRIDNIYFIHYQSSASPYEVATALQKHPAVEFAEPKYIRHLYITPNDSLLYQQYHLDLIKAAQAWDIIKGEASNIVIAIVDGGTDIYHPDLYANLWTNPGEIPNNQVDDDQNGFIDDIHGARMADKKGEPTRPYYATSYGAHGTHTAGIAAAVTNNRIGIAGVSWNAKIMAVHAGSLTSESQIPHGFEGILYAVKNGAKIINCSWGGSSYSEYEARIINYVTELGAVVVAAYGNDGKETETQYPAAYAGVCGVAATDQYDRKTSFSSWGYSADVCAPGSNIFSLYPSESYGTMSGTSMATPIASGILALLLTQNPNWSGLQAAEQLRVTADNIDILNSAYAGKLGRGRVNAYRALTESSPSLRITHVGIVDQDSLIKPGEKIKVSLRLKNYLADAHNILLTLSENSPYADMINSSAAIATLAGGEEIFLPGAFEFQVANQAPSGHVIPFKLKISSGTYIDTDHFNLTVLPPFANLTINHISTTVTNVGRIGFGDPSSSASGIGFKHFNGPNLLCEGAIIAGTGPTRIVNAARGLIVGGHQPYDQDFTVANGGDLVINTPGAISDQESSTVFNDSRAQTPLNIQISQKTFAFNREPFQDIIIIRFTITNQSTSELKNFHFGLFFDWDMDGGTFATNVADYDPQRRLGYVYDSGSGPETYVGVQLLTPGNISYRAIYNDHAHPSNPSWGLHDGFTDEEKWQAISGGTTLTKAGPADVSHVIAAGPYTIAANGMLQLDFSLIAGINLQQLQQNADAAFQMHRQLFSTGISETLQPLRPTSYSLQQNYPNPFNATTTIAYSLAADDEVDIAIFDLKGRRSKTLVHGPMPAGHHRITWDAKDEAGNPLASGTYIYRLMTSSGIHYAKKLILLK